MWAIFGDLKWYHVKQRSCCCFYTGSTAFLCLSLHRLLWSLQFPWMGGKWKGWDTGQSRIMKAKLRSLLWGTQKMLFTADQRDYRQPPVLHVLHVVTSADHTLSSWWTRSPDFCTASERISPVTWRAGGSMTCAIQRDRPSLRFSHGNKRNWHRGFPSSQTCNHAVHPLSV